MSKNDVFKYLTRIHKWAGLIIGGQIILWFASGLFMSWFYIDQVRGDWVAEGGPITPAQSQTLSLQEAAGLYSGVLRSISRQSYAGHYVYEMDGDAGRAVIDAQSGAPWQPLSDAAIRAAANIYYFGEGEIETAALLSDPPQEYAGSIPVWQIKMSGAQRTRLYIHPETGELLSTRTRLWRVFDFMWGLHIMDWDTRSNFNSWWLKLASAAALLFALTGVGLLVHRFALRPKRAQ